MKKTVWYNFDTVLYQFFETGTSVRTLICLCVGRGVVSTFYCVQTVGPPILKKSKNRNKRKRKGKDKESYIFIVHTIFNIN